MSQKSSFLALLCCSLPVWPWASGFSSLGLTFCLYKGRGLGCDLQDPFHAAVRLG